MSAPLVTVVTPSYNQAAYLEDAIESVLAQDYPRIEYAVADGGSADGSVEILKRYEDRLAWWTSGPDGGQSAALNTAFARAQGEILGWLNSDDTLLPGAVSRVVAELERDPELALVYGDAEFVDEAGAPMFTPSLAKVSSASLSANAVCTHAFVGMQPTRRQVPPSSGSRSTHATFAPSCAARIAAV